MHLNEVVSVSTKTDYLGSIGFTEGQTMRSNPLVVVIVPGVEMLRKVDSKAGTLFAVAVGRTFRDVKQAGAEFCATIRLKGSLRDPHKLLKSLSKQLAKEFLLLQEKYKHAERPEDVPGWEEDFDFIPELPEEVILDMLLPE